jgi:hypothetical protein
MYVYIERAKAKALSLENVWRLSSVRYIGCGVGGGASLFHSTSRRSNKASAARFISPSEMRCSPPTPSPNQNPKGCKLRRARDARPWQFSCCTSAFLRYFLAIVCSLLARVALWPRFLSRREGDRFRRNLLVRAGGEPVRVSHASQYEHLM